MMRLHLRRAGATPNLTPSLLLGPLVWRASLLLAVLVAALFAARVAPGQEPKADASEDGAWSEVLEAGERYLRQGRREAARTRFDEVLAGVDEAYEDDRPTAKERGRALLGKARIEGDYGRYDDAKALLEEARRLEARPELELAASRIETRVGEYEAALRRLDALALGDSNTVHRIVALAERGRLLRRLGRRADARRDFEAVVAANAAQNFDDAARKTALGIALCELGSPDQLYEASSLFIEVTKQDPLYVDAYLELGDLHFRVWREVAGRPSGESEYKRALEHCGDHELVLVALYRTRKENFLLESDKTDSYLRRALAINKNSVPALVARASNLIDERRFGAARSVLQQALSINARDVTALSEMAAVCNLLYREADEKVFRERAAAVDPTSVEADALLGKHLIALYRFADAIPILNRARAKDPEDVPTLLSLGRALLYAGRAEEGARLLEETKKIERGFVNPWRDNQIALQRRVDETYEKVEIGNFVFQIHPSEKDVLVPYLSREYEEARKLLGTKYGVTPDCKVQVENFRRFGDFSVRTVGFKGFGALGACFGCLITSVSPAAPELRSQFSWKVTAWHEFAHVLHLQLSKARVPRWLTEGAAVAEEIALDASFDRRMEREVYSALVTDSVIGVDELNKVFGSSQILLGYYQGGLICRHISEKWGFAKVVDIIKAFGEDLGTGEIFERELGMSPDAYDEAFQGWLRERLGDYALVPTIDEAALTSLLEAAAQRPDDAKLRLRLAQGFEQRGNPVDTGAQLAILAKLDPKNGDAMLLRAKMAARRKDLDGARKYLVQGFENGGDDFDSRMLHASILISAGREEAALDELGRAIACWPTCPIGGDASPFVMRSRLFKKLGREAEALDELVRYTSIVGKDYEAQVELAQHWQKAGQVDRELACLERARDIDPFDRSLHERLATIYGTRGRHEEAAFCLRIAIAVKPELDRKARASGGEGNEPAADAAGSVDDERRDAARLRVLLAESLLQAGRATEAKAEAERALRDADLLDSSFTERAKAVTTKR